MILYLYQKGQVFKLTLGYPGCKDYLDDNTLLIIILPNMKIMHIT